MTRLPIRWKVTLAFAGALAVVLTAAGAFLYVRLDAELTQALDRGLRARAHELSGLVDRSGFALQRPLTPGLEADESIAQILRADGTVVAATSHADVPLLNPRLRRAARERPVFADRPGDQGLDESVRLLAAPVTTQGGTFLVVVAASNDEKREALSSLLALSILGLGSALVVSSAAGYVVAGLALRPVDDLRRRAEAITAEGDETLPVSPVDDELGKLGTTLNAMLTRIRRARAAEQEALEKERRFVADASHQLRTPLTIIKSEIDLALLGEAGTQDLRRALTSTAEETDRLALLVDHLLLIAAFDDDRVPIHREQLDVVAVLESVAARQRPHAAATGRAIRTSAPPGLTVVADRIRLEQALTNLVDNAVVHGHGDVELSAELRDDDVCIRVCDSGPGFPDGFAAHAFERFSRANGLQTGSGLGLAIVQGIVDAHGGRVTASNVHCGGQVLVMLPGGSGRL